MMRFRYFALILAGLTCATLAAAGSDNRPPGLNDFAWGLPIQIESDLPLQRALLPDAVYAAVTQPDLSDLRVFNAEGVPLSHALCPQQSMTGQTTRISLPVFALQRAAEQETGTDIQIRTADGTDVRVQQPAKHGSSENEISGHVIDARGAEHPLRSLRLQWQATDGASEMQVRVLASNNLNQWQTLVPSARLLQIHGANNAPARSHIELPDSTHDYLRLERIGDGPQPQLRNVTADIVMSGVAAQPVEFPAMPGSAPEKPLDEADRETEHWQYPETGRNTPVSRIRLHLPEPNMALSIAVDSRPREGQSWRERWRGRVHSVSGPQPPAAEFTSTTDPDWRLRLLSGGDTLGGRPVSILFGYMPKEIHFLTQGSAPFLLAYGSGSHRSEAQACGSLIPDIDREQQQKLTGTAHVQADRGRRELGGERALRVLPQPTAWTRYLLWGVLLAGAGILILLAVRLLRQSGT